MCFRIKYVKNKDEALERKNNSSERKLKEIVVSFCFWFRRLFGYVIHKFFVLVGFVQRRKKKETEKYIMDMFTNRLWHFYGNSIAKHIYILEFWLLRFYNIFQVTSLILLGIYLHLCKLSLSSLGLVLFVFILTTVLCSILVLFHFFYIHCSCTDSYGVYFIDACFLLANWPSVVVVCVDIGIHKW